MFSLEQARCELAKLIKAKLRSWWEGLEQRFRELEQKQADRQATVADQYSYAKDGTVVPGIAGGVKKRRKDRES